MIELPPFTPHPDALKRDRADTPFDFKDDRREFIPGISVVMMVMHPPIDRLAALTTLMLPYVNEIIIVDTGSSDADRDTMLSWNYEYSGPVIVLDREFKDFSTTRNQALIHAKSEWSFIIDPDEIPSYRLMAHMNDVVDRPESYKRIKGFTHLSLNWWRGILGPVEEYHWHVRFFRTKGSYLYRPIHELVAVNGRKEHQMRGTPALPKAPWEAYIIHSKGAADIDRSNAFYRDMGNKSVL